MKNLAAIIPTVCLALFGQESATSAQTHLMRYADVHGDTVVFTYEDDLWLAPTEGGDARRITRDPGAETWAKFSPDGQSIAFTAQYDGGTDVYVVNAQGGVPTRLTFHPARDRVLGWHPDGKRVLFRSVREYPSRAEKVYLVSIEGGMPTKLPVDRAGLSTFSPDGKQFAYNRISREARTWKRHQGGTAQDIWLGTLDRGDFHKITDWVGTDNFPMWAGDAIYFSSDRKYGTLNLYKYEVSSGKLAALTEYKNYDVKNPSIGVNAIVFEHEASLSLLDLKTGEVRAIDIHMRSDRVRMRRDFVKVNAGTGSFRLSPSGKRLVVATRGEVLNIPAEDGESINVTRTLGSREKDAVWSPDGRWIAFISDKTGEEEVYLVDQEGKEGWRQLTSDGSGFRKKLVWSPDSRWLIFSDKYLRLNLLNVETGQSTVVDRSDYDDGWYRWGIQDYSWSPDSKWIAYSKLERSGYESIFLYSMKEKKSHRVTSEMTPDWSPSFDPDGRYLYFLSGRTFNPIMGFVDQNYAFLDIVKPYVVILKDDAPSPFAPEDSTEEIQDEDAKESSQENSDNEGAKTENADSRKDEKKDVEIDLDGIQRRIIEAKGVKPGNLFRLEATEKGFCYLAKAKHEFIKYQQVNDGTADELDLYHYNLEDHKTKKVLADVTNYHLSADGKKLVYRSDGAYGVADTAKKVDSGDGQVSLKDVRIAVNRAEEFRQIFDEAWRVQRDWFYDPGMHGLDWKATGDKYRKFLPDCGNRADLNYLIGEMIGELNTGHTYVSGGDIARKAKRVRTGLLGADFVAESGKEFYRIAHVIPGTPWNTRERSPLAEPGCPIKVGDYLIAIDGHRITTKDNIYEPLQNKRNAVVTIQYNDKPTASGAKTYRAKTIGSERSIRYREWVENNRAFIDEATNGLVGYLHIPNMMGSGLVEFARVFHPHHYKKAFIIDERYNGGGFTSQMIIDRLERTIFGMTQPREGKPSADPERVFYGHYAVLINEDTGSAGEWFAEAIKRKGIAPLIGKRTWGGAVGIELHQPLIDGGGTTPPQFAPYALDRTWMIEGHGVDPDIDVQNMPVDVLKGKDAQLEAAIESVIERLRQNPMEIPPPPAYPVKSKR